MKMRKLCRAVVVHGTAAALGLNIVFGAAGALISGEKGLPTVMTASAEGEQIKKGKGTVRYGGNTYQYSYSEDKNGKEIFSLNDVSAGERTVSIPSRVYVDGRYHTVNALGVGFGKNLRAESVYIPDTVETIGGSTFFQASVNELRVSSGVKSIGAYFCVSNNIKHITYNGNQLEELGTGAFSGEGSRGYIGLTANSKGAVLFGDWIIRYIGKEKEVRVSDLGDGRKIRKIGPYCFSTKDEETNLSRQRIDLSGIEVIADHAFADNKELRYITGEQDVKTFSYDAFTDTLWYRNGMARRRVVFGKTLLYYHTDGDVIDLSLSQFSNVRYVLPNSIVNCDKATVIKLGTEAITFDKDAFGASGTKNISTVYVGGRNRQFSLSDQFIPDVINDNYSLFRDSAYIKKFTDDKVKYLFGLMGITYYGESGKGGVSGLSPEQKFEAAYKLHEYMSTNFVYKGETLDFIRPLLDGKSGFVCQQFGELYAYLLECAGINADVVDSIIPGENGKYIYNGAHTWTILEIGGKWYHADVCWDAVSHGLGQAHSMNFFMISDECMSKEESSHKMWHYNRYGQETKPFMDGVGDVPKCSILLGDANGDGERTSADAELIQKYLLGDAEAKKTIKLQNCDTNFSGDIEFTDIFMARTLAQHRSVNPLKGTGIISVRENRGESPD